jgi:hypothetical protein
MNSLIIFDLDGETATLPLHLPGIVDVAIIAGGA